LELISEKCNAYCSTVLRQSLLDRNADGKSKLPLAAWREGKGGVYRYTSILSFTCALDGVGGQRHALAVLTPGKTRHPLYRRQGGPQEDAQNLAPTGVRTPKRPARSHLLHRLSYPDQFTKQNKMAVTANGLCDKKSAL
jgi:hypothetical protein